MKNAKYRVIVVTCANLPEARKIARAAVNQSLAACVNIFHAPVESVYRWKHKVERAREYLLIIKTVAKHLRALQRLVKALHSYKVPEFIALPILTGSQDYLAWLDSSTSTAKSRQAPKPKARS